MLKKNCSIHTPLWLLVCVLMYQQAALAQNLEFNTCLLELQQRARSEQISNRVVEEVVPRLKQQPRVIELDRSQPEFTQTFANYFYQRVTPERIEQGKRILQQYDSFLARLTREHGVPGRYLVAFWGLETNFGSYLGKMPTLDSLATLACDQRRSEFFTDELMHALALLERESLTPSDMHGSWAGAMGHTQFMPSAYRRYAIDGDGDGRIDLWSSERDALASGANYLAHLGWHKGQRWGREVLLPAGFPYAETGLNNRRPLAYWKKLGVGLANGYPVPDIDMQAAVLVPAGHQGPAFMVYPNFDIILEWNRSEYYALAVGLLADRLIGAGPLVRPPSTRERAPSRVAIEKMQQQLNRLGFEAGEVDGVMGAMTQSALRKYQASKGIIADGYPGPATLCALSITTGPGSCQ
jgi:membrane-bound lytic murein transglycosylase B